MINTSQNRQHASQISFSSASFIISAFCQIDVVQVLDHTEPLLIFHRDTKTLFFPPLDVAWGNAFKCVCKGASHPSESHSET